MRSVQSGAVLLNQLAHGFLCIILDTLLSCFFFFPKRKKNQSLFEEGPSVNEWGRQGFYLLSFLWDWVYGCIGRGVVYKVLLHFAFSFRKTKAHGR